MEFYNGEDGYYGPKFIKDTHDFLMSIRDDPNNNKFSEWLYGEYDEGKLDAVRALRAVPVVSDYMDYLLDRRSDMEYLNRYGMDYSDIHDPRKLSSVNSGGRVIGSASRMVSRNFARLYA